MNFLSEKLVFPLLGLLVMTSFPLFAEECEVKAVADLEKCKDKEEVKTSGPRVEMFDVPEHFALADPSFSGGEGLQDYMSIEDTQIILHTKEEVQCPEKIEVKGKLTQVDLEGNKAWLIEVSEFKCL